LLEVSRMVKGAGPIKVAPDSELGRLLDAASLAPVVLEKDGVRYRVGRLDADDPSAGYDPEAVRAAIRLSAGVLKPADAEALKAGIYRAREEGSRPE
jgi:hypothetical protein